MEAHRKLAATKNPIVRQQERAIPEPVIAHRLDEAVARLDITHDELARRIGIGKTTYYAVRKGEGKRSTQLKVERYLDKLNKSEA
jgi:DNA-binding XRE family transcriptional regulator